MRLLTYDVLTHRSPIAQRANAQTRKRANPQNGSPRKRRTVLCEVLPTAGRIRAASPSAGATHTDCRGAPPRCRRSPSAPRTLLPAASSGGEITAMPNCPATRRSTRRRRRSSPAARSCRATCRSRHRGPPSPSPRAPLGRAPTSITCLSRDRIACRRSRASPPSSRGRAR